MGNVITAIKTAGNAFGVGSNLADQITEKVEKFAQDGEDWANSTASDWYDSAPWATGNLRESIDVDTSDLSAPRVFVNKQKLMAHAGQRMPAVRLWYKKNGRKVITIPNSDYLLVAEENAASASKTTNPITPNAEREMASGKGTSPFLNSIWEELWKKNKRIIFNG